jgi:hypothetical protein
MQTTSVISPVTTREILMATPLPKKTASYSPVPHKKVINLVLESLDKAGMQIISERYKSMREGRQGMGFYTIANGSDKEMQISLIWHNSYDKSMPLRAAMGGNVIVCTNGIVRGDMGAFKRKHTGTVLTEFEETIKRHIGEAGETFRKLVADREKMKEIKITKRVCAELIGRMHIENDIITATQIGIMKKELENPTFNYKADGTLWQLYNHATFALKEDHPQFHLERHMNVHDFFTSEYQLIS